MGRSKGKGKKQTVIASHEDPGNSKEENVASNRRRGRPTKPLKDDSREEEEAAEMNQDGKDTKNSIPGKEVKGPSAIENGRKRKGPEHANENTESIKEENEVGTKLGTNNSIMSTGFRQIGSRRKNKPRRAAEAVVECN